MSMTADQIVDRRRMRRKLSFWRFIGFAAVILLIGGAMFAAVANRNGGSGFATQPQIARISVSGFIAEDRDQAKMLADLAKNNAIKGVIVSINSTGGSTTGGEQLYESLRKLAAAKPTVATIGTVGASAAYMAAIATDHIVARRTSITGSIGVIFEYPEVSALLDKLGVKVEDIKSAPLKAEPDPFHPTSDEARAVIQGLVNDTFGWFVDIVAERRNMPRPLALTLADGRIYNRAAGAERQAGRRTRRRGSGSGVARYQGGRRQVAGEGLGTFASGQGSVLAIVRRHHLADADDRPRARDHACAHRPPSPGRPEA